MASPAVLRPTDATLKRKSHVLPSIECSLCFSICSPSKDGPVGLYGQTAVVCSNCLRQPERPESQLKRRKISTPDPSIDSSDHSMDCSQSEKDFAVFNETIVEKPMFFIGEVAEQFRATNMAQPLQSTKLATCPHVAIFEDNRLNACEHCKEKFCKLCLKEHFETLSFDIELISNTFSDRLKSLLAAFNDGKIKSHKVKRQLSSAMTVSGISEEIFNIGNELVGKDDSQVANKFQKVLSFDQKLFFLEEIANENIKLDQEFQDIEQFIECFEKFMANLTLAEAQYVPVFFKNLVEAAEYGQLLKMRRILEPLLFESEMLSYLMEKRFETHRGGTILHIAAAKAHSALVTFLLQQDFVDVHAKDNQGFQPIYLVFSETNPKHEMEKCTNIFIEHDSTLASTACVDPYGFNLLQLSARFDLVNLAKNLIENFNFNANLASDPTGSCPLLLSILAKSEKMCNYLMGKGADMNIRRRSDYVSVIHAACSTGNEEMVKLLLDRDKEMVNLRALNGTKPIHHAITNGHVKLVDNLLFDFDNTKEDLNLCLYLACSHGNLELVKLLISYGAEAVQYSRGRNLLHVVSEKGHLQLFDYLMEKQHLNNHGVCDANAKTSDGSMVLHLAAANGHYDLVKRIVERHKVVNLPLQMEGAVLKAMAHDHRNIVDYLMNKQVK